MWWGFLTIRSSTGRRRDGGEALQQGLEGFLLVVIEGAGGLELQSVKTLDRGSCSGRRARPMQSGTFRNLNNWILERRTATAAPTRQ